LTIRQQSGVAVVVVVVIHQGQPVLVVLAGVALAILVTRLEVV
jgi:hypothetical protein